MMLRTLLFGLIVVTCGFAVTQTQKEKRPRPIGPDEYEIAYIELGKEIREVWSRERLQELWQRLPDRELFCRRLLLDKEQKLYKKILDYVRSEGPHWWYQESALTFLMEVPHVTLIEPLTEFIRSIPKKFQKHPDWVDKYGAKAYWRPQETALVILAMIPDQKVVDILWEFAEKGHPNRKVKGTIMEWLMRIKACTQFCLLVGRSDWAIEVGNSMIAEEPIELRKKLLAEFESWVERIGKWWKENRGKVKIRWERAGLPVEVLPPGYRLKEP